MAVSPSRRTLFNDLLGYLMNDVKDFRVGSYRLHERISVVRWDGEHERVFYVDVHEDTDNAPEPEFKRTQEAEPTP